MRFWDSSAVASLVLDDVFSGRARVLADEDPRMVVWWGTPIEATSAVFRAVRAGRLAAEGAPAAVGRLASIAAPWTEVPATPELRVEACRLLAVHPLWAGEAVQLAAALVAAGGAPAALPFVCFDERLGDAARAEGLAVLGGQP